MTPRNPFQQCPDAACCTPGGSTGVPTPRGYAVVAEQRFRTLHLFAVPRSEVAAVQVRHPEAMCGPAAEQYLNQRACRSAAAELAMSDVFEALLEMRQQYPDCEVFLHRELPAVA